MSSIANLGVSSLRGMASLLVLSWCAVAQASSEANEPELAPALNVVAPIVPKPLQDIDIADRLGNKVPLDAALVNESGEAVRLGDYFTGEFSGKPVLLVLGYYSCPMLCSLVLNGVMEGLQQIDYVPGKDFTLVSVSIDSRDTYEVARDKRNNYLKTYRGISQGAGIHFHVADEQVSRAIANSVGFGYRWDDKTQQYAHAAGVFFISPDGTLTRTLFGLTFSRQDLSFALMEASRGEVGSIVDKVILSCFSYTSDKQKYGIYIFGLFRLAGVITILLLGGLLVSLWRRERIHNGSSRT